MFLSQILLIAEYCVEENKPSLHVKVEKRKRALGTLAFSLNLREVSSVRIIQGIFI